MNSLLVKRQLSKNYQREARGYHIKMQPDESPSRLRYKVSGPILTTGELIDSFLRRLVLKRTLCSSKAGGHVNHSIPDFVFAASEPHTRSELRIEGTLGKNLAQQCGEGLFDRG
ncbi:hypothetical protein EVAR_54704_1 [Eumeta japonica]|uniref:Uncharacterized protein n=1 Tax=Eumeta variegata TaxID=151549 RepID=A0A4C1YQZ1_EUMVA|nr:hypothetical protein EVAR_54704_1 [Eumeta japonica]